MGCDIHCFVEKKINGAWTSVWPELVKTKEDADHIGRLVTGEEFNRIINAEFDHPLYIHRSYMTFGALAGVRHHEVPRVREPRGFPTDAARDAAWLFKAFGVDAHSPSWLTLLELQAHDWSDPRYLGQCAHFQETVLPALQALGAPDDVRIVFFFDN